MGIFKKIIEKFIIDITKAEGAVIAEILLIISSLTYLIKLNNYNEMLKNSYSDSDNVIDKSLRVFSTNNGQSSFLYFILGIILVFCLFGIFYYLFKRGYKSLMFLFGLVNLIFISLIFKSLLAPIIASLLTLGTFTAVIFLALRKQ
ncbi:hypothetical protein [Lactococcus sp. dk322]|uniref:hypothetical protein n=1 Tax=Lactococcus sp. dk322 TaxID=2603290 RepID=UPI0011C9104F|nr:hypothetical protein [Lactococcus sp. dk322]TXK46780.1 hypothetical protein FVP43_10820 [Lactococcus sp. dk322]